MDTYKYYVGVDLGEVQDYSAVSVIERQINWREDRGVFLSDYYVRELIRFPKRTQYPQIVDKIKLIFENPYINTYGELIVDQTGVGRPVIEMMEREGLKPFGITITGGNTVVKTVDGCNVPKNNIVSAFLILAQSAQVHVASDLKLAKDFQREMEAFTVKINKKTGNQIYEGEGTHDDLVISVALPLWYAHEYDIQMQTVDRLTDDYDVDEKRNIEEYDPLTWGLG